MLLPILLALAPLSPTAEPLEARERVAKESSGTVLLREAKSLRYSQRFFEAAALYRRYLAENPNGDRCPEARFWLAATLEQDQRWDEAASAYSEFLSRHPDERMLGKEARLNRVRCWGIRQGQSPEATPGLVAALVDEVPEVQVAAALQLAKSKDRRSLDGLQKGLAMPAYADACSLSLISLGVKPAPTTSQANRFLVMRIREKGKDDPVMIRLAIGLARALENYLSDEQIQQARKKGIELGNLSDRAATLPKGSLLFSVEDGKSSITVTVE
jgi:tetratricopeptide (TPR) repeat protein